ncbi:MAG: GIY-YIG nuclease family protein [Gemmataceae bacterium]|nr:GIY-YIG nuclease family protein [Gemmataceae bacterium]
MATFPWNRKFMGFGSTSITPCDFTPLLGRIQGKAEAELWEKVRQKAPRLSGVYGMLNRSGELIYIGKAKNLRARLMSYFRKNSRDPKAGRILESTRYLLWESTPDEFSALVRELELIHHYRPKYNVLGVPDRRRWCYLCLGRSPAPYLFVSKRPTEKAIAVYGPLYRAFRAKDTARKLNDYFGLRDCPQSQPMHFSDQPQLFPLELRPQCLRGEIKTCVAPCAGMCSRGEYAALIDAVRAFLDGRNNRPIHDLVQRMTEAAHRCEFERAIVLRDKLRPIQWIAEKLAWLREARRDNTFVYPLTNETGQTIWYLIERGRVRRACYEPQTELHKQKAQELLSEVYGPKPKQLEGIGHADSVLLVAGWFKKRPEEKQKTLSVDQACHLLGNV